MAIYHFRGTMVSRSQGRSVVAASAYRAGETLYDERQEMLHDYTKKKDVVYKDILLPDAAPRWMADREKLWNAVEVSEKRKDAQLARDFNFSLPKELSNEQNIALARSFVQDMFVKSGMIADLCIHHEGVEGDSQPHAHVLLTLREVNQEGFGQKVRAWNDKALLLHWRETWAEYANYHLALHGHDLRIDHRTLAEQGIDLEPQYKIGTAVAKDRMARMADHTRIAKENGERLLADPEIALYAITRQQSTFTHADIARFVNRHTVDAAQFTSVFEKVKSHESLMALSVDQKGAMRFTTKAMLALEAKMLGDGNTLAKREAHLVSQHAKAVALNSKSLTAEQTIAFEHLLNSGDLKCVVGFAGTGKSYLLGAAREAWEQAGFRVHGVTLSGIAAENLEGASGIKSRTFASRTYYWDKGEEGLTKKDIVVVDEAGMLSSEQMAKVLQEAEQGQAKVVLVGDPMQLQAIEAGAPFRALAESHRYVSLTDIRRQSIAWQQDATKALAIGETKAAIDLYAEKSHVHDFVTKQEAKVALTEVWQDARLTNPTKTQIMLAYNRDDVRELNVMARDLKRKEGELGNDYLFTTERGERSFAQGDRLYFLKNDKALGVMNGTLGTIAKIDNKTITIRIDGKEQKNITISMDCYAHIDHGYAATIHKAQGVTVDRSYVLASPYLDAHATYVAMSRHRESVDLWLYEDSYG